MALGTRAGLYKHESSASLPAATTTVILSAIAALTAESSAELAEPPRLIFITAGRDVWWLTTQFSALMIVEVGVPPLQGKTRTGISVTCLATP